MDPKLEERPERPELIEVVHATSGGVELALAAALGLGLGYVLDGIFGIRPVLTIVCFLWFAIALGFVFYSRYRAAMEIHEAQLPSSKLASAELGEAGALRSEEEPAKPQEPELPSVADLYLADVDSEEFVAHAQETLLGEARRS